jgi:hypothetical protein
LGGAYNTDLDEVRSVLSLDGYWSDINQNGLPEVSIFYWYCPNACHGYEGSVHFYEIQSSETVAHISASFEGILLPWKVLHSKNPPTLYLFDPTLEFEAHQFINTWWIYGWDGEQFIDITSEYADEYLVNLEQTVHNFQDQYGVPIDDYMLTRFLNVLFQSEKYGVRDEAFEAFWEITEPSNWPGTEPIYACWLQIAREQAAQQYSDGIPFTKPPTPFGLSVTEGFDIQSCQFTDQ